MRNWKRVEGRVEAAHARSEYIAARAAGRTLTTCDTCGERGPCSSRRFFSLTLQAEYICAGCGEAALVDYRECLELREEEDLDARLRLQAFGLIPL